MCDSTIERRWALTDKTKTARRASGDRSQERQARSVGDAVREVDRLDSSKDENEEEKEEDEKKTRLTLEPGTCMFHER